LTDSELIIKKLNLQEHPYEGGNFRETYRSSDLVSYDESLMTNQDIPCMDMKERSLKRKLRPASSLIYYLLNKDQFSPIHRVKSDEIWHFYLGSPLIIYILGNKQYPTKVKLGNNLEDDNSCLHYVIRKNSWFCAEVENKESFSLVGCTVSPGFDFEDFELGKKPELLILYPQHELIIEKFSQ
jgi:uncharacterized protein